MSSLMTVEPWGGVNEYGRNCFYIECSKKRILLDCGSGYLTESYIDILDSLKKDVKETLRKKGNILFLSHIYGKGTEMFILLLKELKNVKFVVTKEFFKGVEDLVKSSLKIDLEELDILKENIELIEESFDVKKLQENSKVYFCENVKAHQSKKEAVNMANEMRIKECIYFHYEGK